MTNPDMSYRQLATIFEAIGERLDYVIERILPNNRQMIGLLVCGNAIPLYLRGAVYTDNQHTFNLWICLYMICYHLFGPCHSDKSSATSETAEPPPSKHIQPSSEGVSSHHTR